MRINVRLLLITFTIVTLVSVSSAVIFYTLSNSILISQQSKSLINSVNQFIFHYQNTEEYLTADFSDFYAEKNFGKLSEYNIDFVFTLENDSLIYPKNFLHSEKIVSNQIISLREFLSHYPNISLHQFRKNQTEVIFYGKIIDSEYLTEISKKINADIALINNNSPIELSTEVNNEKYFLPLLEAAQELKFKNNFDLTYKELETEDFYASKYKPPDLRTGTGSDLSFIIFTTPTDAFNFRGTIKFILFIIIFSGMALSLIFVLLFTTKFRKQISFLINGVEAIKKGDLNSRVEVISKDEIGRLGTTFNAMLDDLEAKERSEKEYSEFIALINRKPTLKEIADAALHKIIISTKLTFGILQLCEGGKYRKISAFGVVDNSNSSTVNLEFYDDVVKNKEPLEFNFTENYPVIKTGLAEITIKYLLIAPIIHNQDVIAVIELASESEPEEDVLPYIANINEQLAVGLANAQALEKLANLVDELKKLNEDYLIQNKQISEQNRQLRELHSQLRSKAEELEKERERAYELANAKSHFLANMSHELKTPLSSILGLTELAINDAATKPITRDRLNIVLKNGKKLLYLITNILEYSKFDLNKAEVNIASFLLNEYIRGIELSAASLLLGKKIKLIFNYPKDEDILVQTDKMKLEHILINILSNAIKFTEAGEVTFSVKAENEDLIFIIRDTGIGIPEEEIKNIFNEFEQSSISKNKETGGTGLGLAIADKFIKLLGGTIEVESKIGKGAAFTLRLPDAIMDIIPFTEKPEVQEPEYRVLFVGAPKDYDFYKSYLNNKIFNINIFNEKEKPFDYNIAIVSIDTEDSKSFKKLKEFALSGYMKSSKNILLIHSARPEEFALYDNVSFFTDTQLTAAPVKSLHKIGEQIEGDYAGAFIGENTFKTFTDKYSIVELTPGNIELVSDNLSRYNFFILPFNNEAFKALSLLRMNKFTLDKPVYFIMPSDDSILDKLDLRSAGAEGNSTMDKNDLLKIITSVLQISPNNYSLTEIENDSEGRDKMNSARVLIVDDHADTLFTVGEIVKNLGYETDFAIDGIECLEKLNKKYYNLILLDIRMPRKDGFQTIKEIRADKNLKHLKVIALTAHTMIEDKSIILDAGFDDLITKPIDHSIIKTKVKSYIDA